MFDTNLTKEQLDELVKFQEKAKGYYEWTLEFRIVPRKSFTGNWTPWFRKIYVGRRTGRLFNQELQVHDVVYASKEEMMWAKIKGDKLPK